MKTEKIKRTLSKHLVDIYNVCVREFKNIFTDTGVIIFFFVVPLAYPLLYASIYDQETVRDVAITVIDNSTTPQSRDFLRRLDGTPDVKIVSYSTDMAAAKEELARKNVYGIVHIPSDFASSTAKGQQSHISLYSDMSSMLYYKSMLISLTEVSMDIGKEIEVGNLSGLTSTQEYVSTQPIIQESVSLFNPSSGFASFLIPAILIIIIQQTMLLGVGMLAGTTRENKSTSSLTHPSINTFGVVIGKALAYFVIYVVITMYLVEFVPALFSLPRIGHLWTKIIFLLPYLTAVIFFAMALSTVVSGRETPMLIFVFTSVPLLFISGISWPEASIPDVWKYIGWMMPSTHGVQGFIKINTMGATISQVSKEYISLWVLTGFYFVTCALLYKRLTTKKLF